MKAEMTAIVENGVLKPDATLPFPDQTRVKVTVEPVEPENQAAAVWERLKARIQQHPVVGLAGRFARDDLYERD